MVCPTISGTTVDRRDQVRNTFFSLREFMPSTRDIRKPSTNAPFLVERAINSALSFQPSALSQQLLKLCHSERSEESWFRLQRYFVRRFTINLSVRLLFRVLYPRVGCPQGVTGCRPPEVLPSPPPCGWSTGFMETPRLCGILPSQRFRPALPSETFSWSTFPTWPTVAMQSSGTRRISPEGSFSSAISPSLFTNCACVPADRAICAPLPGFNSMLCTTVPAGIFLSGNALPIRM